MTEQQLENFVLKSQCENTHKNFVPKWVMVTLFTIIVAVMGLFVTLVGYSALETRAAASMSLKSMEKAENIARSTERITASLASHIDTSKVKEVALVEKLEEIKEELVRQRKEQNAILKTIMQLQIKISQEKKHESISD